MITHRFYADRKAFVKEVAGAEAKDGEIPLDLAKLGITVNWFSKGDTVKIELTDTITRKDGEPDRRVVMSVELELRRLVYVGKPAFSVMVLEVLGGIPVKWMQS